MKIVHLINGLGRGGGERLLVRLVAALARDHCAVYCLTRRGPLAEELAALGVPVRLLTWGGLPLPHNLLRLACDLYRADVMHTHFFYSDLLGSLLGRLLRVPRRISTRHDTGYWMRRAHRVVEAWLYRGFHQVICVSRAVRNAMVARGVEAQRLTVVPPGVASLACGEREPMAAAPYVLSVGRLEHVKGHDVLLDAFARVAQAPALADFRVVVVGDGSERRALQARALALGLAGRCQFVGEQTSEQITALLRGASIFVLPSRSEAFGLSLLEAMQCGVACVAAGVGGVPEVVRHKENGVLVVPENIEALARAIVDLAGQPAVAARLGRRAKQDVERTFPLHRFVRGVEAVYRGEP